MHAQANSSSPLAAPPEPLTVDAEQSTHALAFVPGLSYQQRLVVTHPFILALLPLTFFPDKLTYNLALLFWQCSSSVFSNYNHNEVWTFPLRPPYSKLRMHIVIKIYVNYIHLCVVWTGDDLVRQVIMFIMFWVWLELGLLWLIKLNPKPLYFRNNVWCVLFHATICLIHHWRVIWMLVYSGTDDKLLQTDGKRPNIPAHTCFQLLFQTAWQNSETSALLQQIRMIYLL